MDLYTMNENFLGRDTIDEFVSAIWTERYFLAGDVQLVVPATQDLVTKLAPDTYLGLRGTKEVMILHTQSIEKNLLTVTGTSLLSYLDHRYAWFRNPAGSVDDDTTRIVDYTDSTRVPGTFLAHVVNAMVINPASFPGEYIAADLSWDLEKIPYLSLAPYDTSGTPKRLTMPIGPLYQGLAQVAEKEGLGISVYLDSADPILGYSLKFSAYRGKDHTSSQSTNPLIRLMPDMETIQDLKELQSSAMYKNVAYVYYQGIVTKHLAEPTLPEPIGMKRRVLVTDAESEPVGRKVTGYYTPWGTFGRQQSYTKYVVGAPEIAEFREQNAKDALANHNYIRSIDGQLSPKNEYRFGVDYGLGDVIELQGLTGLITKARVTEYIRSSDNVGEREYPTISVIS